MSEKPPAYDGREIANFILDRCNSNGTGGISNLRLQKIMYFCHVSHLVSTRQPLIRHQFEAWQFGPVLPYVYRVLQRYGDGPITQKLMALDRETGGLMELNPTVPDDLATHLSEVIDMYCEYSSGDLVRLTHIPQGPWWKAWHHDSIVNPGMKINDQDILSFYSSH